MPRASARALHVPAAGHSPRRQLHNIGKVLVVNHRDCGAAKIAYGADAVANPGAETKTHREALAEFRGQLKARHPKLGIEAGLMALDGKLEVFA